AVRRDGVVRVVSYVTQPEFCFAPFGEVIESVRGLETIDLTIMGGAYASDFFVRLAQYRAHQRGVVPGARAIGASFHDRIACGVALESALVDVAFARYNPMHLGAEQELFPRLGKAGRASLYNFKSTNGYLPPERYAALGVPADKWRPEVTDYYRFALTRPEVDGILCAP